MTNKNKKRSSENSNQYPLSEEQYKKIMESGRGEEVLFKGYKFTFKKFEKNILGVRWTDNVTTIIDRCGNLVATYENLQTNSDEYVYSIIDASGKEIGYYYKMNVDEFHYETPEFEKREFIHPKNPSFFIDSIYENLKNNNCLVSLEETINSSMTKKQFCKPINNRREEDIISNINSSRKLEYVVERISMPEQDRLEIEKELLAQRKEVENVEEELVETKVEVEIKKPVYKIIKSQTELYCERLNELREKRDHNFLDEVEEDSLENNVEKSFENNKIYEEIKMNEHKRNRETILDELVGLYLSIGPITTAEDFKKSENSLKDKKSLMQIFNGAIQDIYRQWENNPDSRVWSVGIDLGVIKTTLDLDTLKDSIKCVKNYFKEIGLESEISEINTNNRKINDAYRVVCVFHPSVSSLEDKVVMPLTSHSDNLRVEGRSRKTEQHKSEINYCERKEAILSILEEQEEIMQNDIVKKIQEKYDISGFTVVKYLKKMEQEKNIIRTHMPGKGNPIKVGKYEKNSISMNDEVYMTSVEQIKYIIDAGIRSQKRIFEILEQKFGKTTKELDYVVKRADKEGHLLRIYSRGFNNMHVTLANVSKKEDSTEDTVSHIDKKRSYHGRKRTDELNDVDNLILETVKMYSGQKNINQIYKILSDVMNGNNEKPIVQQTLINRLKLFEKKEYIKFQMEEGNRKSKFVVYAKEK